MKLFETGETIDVQTVEKGVRDAYGISPGRKMPQGSSGAFMFNLGDVFVSDKVWAEMRRHTKLGWELYTSLLNIYAEEYGDVSRAVADNNGENRWLCGSAEDLQACYPIQCCGKHVRFFCGYSVSIFYWEDEEIPAEWTRLNKSLASLRQIERQMCIQTHWPRGFAWMDRYKTMVTDCHGKISKRNTQTLSFIETCCLWRMRHLVRTNQV